jgi:lysophospholipase L1-like esterase
VAGRAARLALVVGSTLVSLAAAEGVYRWHTAAEPAPTDDPAWRAQIRAMNRTIYRRSADPALVYEPNPGASVAMPYGEAGFNREGMRDDREHALAPDGRLRIALLGDSIVWSEEVALRESLARTVERAMGGEAKVEVLAFGVSGYDTAQEARWYERAVRPYRPAVVALVYCLNDAMIASGPYNRFGTPEELDRKAAEDALWNRLAPLRAETIDVLTAEDERAATFRLIWRARWWWKAWRHEHGAGYTDEMILSHAQPDRAARVRDALARLGAALRADGARAHLFISPVLKSWDAYRWGEIHAQVAAWASAAGFSVHDPLPEWTRTEHAAALQLPGDPLHYGPLGNDRFGRFIATRLLAENGSM